MAEEQQQDRTEQATPKRREEARKKGDVPRSRELTMTGVMLSGGSALLLLAELQLARMQGAAAGAVRGCLRLPPTCICRCCGALRLARNHSVGSAW